MQERVRDEQPATSTPPGPAETGAVPSSPHRLSFGEWVDVVQAQVGKGGRYAARVARAGSYRIVSGGEPGPGVRVR